MSKSPTKLVPFDAARCLDSDEAIAEYMTAVLEAEDPDLLLLALSDIARAKGMAQVAKDAGLGRESLYKALAPGAKPRFETVVKVARALGVRFTAEPAVAVAPVRPNPSRKPTRTGKAAGPRGGSAAHPPRGRTTSPVRAAWLER